MKSSLQRLLSSTKSCSLKKWLPRLGLSTRRAIEIHRENLKIRRQIKIVYFGSGFQNAEFGNQDDESEHSTYEIISMKALLKYAMP
jgi:hypothetical protein